MRKLIATASTAAMMLALTATPAMADTQEGLVNVGDVAVGVNACDINVIVENDAAAPGECTNTQNN